jgi:hypothetical protein
MPYGTTVNGPVLERTVRVGSYTPNAFGLRDMHGNVVEWCQDWWDPDYYRKSPRDDPRGPKTSKYRAFRGGSWKMNPGRCRSAYRNGAVPSTCENYTGFRVVTVPVNTPEQERLGDRTMSDESQTRTWTDSTGKFTINAVLIRIEDEKVCLRKRDGTVVFVPILRLSGADRQYLRKQTGRTETTDVNLPGKKSEAPVWVRIVLDNELFPDGKVWSSCESVWQALSQFSIGIDPEKATASDAIGRYRVRSQEFFSKYGPGQIKTSTGGRDEGVIYHYYGPIGFGLKPGEKSFSWLMADNWLYKKGFIKAAREQLQAGGTGPSNR